MNLTVFTGPCPEANVTELFRRTPLGGGSICAVVPDLRSVTAMEQSLAEYQEGAFLGHRVYTFEGLARAIISLTGSIPETIENHVKRALIGEIVKSRIGTQSRFYGVSGYHGFVSLVVSFLEDIRSRRDGIVSHEPELVSIARAYESHLNRLGVTDHEGSIILALKGNMIERFTETFKGPLIVDGFYDLTDTQFELLSRLFRNFGRSAVTLVNGKSISSLFSLPTLLVSKYKSIGAKIVKVDSKPSTGPEIILSGFMSGKYNDYSKSGEAEIHTFQSEASEADWIAGKIRIMLVNKICLPKDIMIVSRTVHDFGSPLDNALKRHCIPVEYGVARALVSHPLIKFALDALDAAINPEEENILNVQSSCYAGRKPFTGEFPVEITDDRAWSCMIAEVDSSEGFASSMKKMFEWFNVRLNLDGGGRKESAILETVVYEKFIELLDEFVTFYSTFRPMMKSKEFSHLLRLFLSDISIAEEGSSGQGVLIFGIEHARFVRRDIVFFKGLDNASFPARNDIFSLHDPKVALKIRKHKDMEEELLFYMSISGAKKLFLTFPGIDDEGKDSSISPYLKKIQKGIESWSKPVFHTGVPGDAWEKGYVTERGKLENIIRVLRDSGDSAVSLLSSLQVSNNDIFAAIENALRSHIKQIAIQDMNLNADDSKEIVAGEWGDERIFSVTDLELYISCPVNFYFSSILGLQRERRLTDELDAIERGIIIHEILAHFYKSLKQLKGRTKLVKEEIEANEILMEEVVENVFQSRVDRLKRLNPVIIGSEKRFIKCWMKYFMELEAKMFEESSFEPYLFEITFGNNSHKPLEILCDNKKIKLGGRIDRIDISVGEDISYFRVIDYKTGQSPVFKDVEKGMALQIPLYIKAVKESILPELSVQSGMYYNLREAQYDRKMKKLKKCTIIDREIDKIIETASNSAVQTALSIRDGSFSAPEKCSDYCEWRSLCRGSRKAQEEIQNAAQ